MEEWRKHHHRVYVSFFTIVCVVVVPATEQAQKRPVEVRMEADWRRVAGGTGSEALSYREGKQDGVTGGGRCSPVLVGGGGCVPHREGTE